MGLDIENKNLWFIALACIAMVWINGCTTFQQLTKSTKQSPHDAYTKGLEKSGLYNSGMAKAWIDAGNPERHDSIYVTLPFRETGYFPATEPQARFYKFDVKAGQVLTLTSLVKAKEDAHIFVDLFLRQDTIWIKKEHADSTLTLTYEFTKNGLCLVRLQPELLVNAFYSITLSVTPVLLNPVRGASNKSIGSFYGDPRDGGKRKHEGIDIFAPKGTPVVAPTAGIITRVANGGLGGKIIWMNDTKRRHAYYFAHLDSQYVKAATRVKQGDTLGTVGNTGNAKYTPAHLHFGVYQRNAIDPIAYIRTMEKLVNELAPDTLFQSIVFRANQQKVPLHVGPTANTPIKNVLSKNVYTKVIAQSLEWYRVRTANDQEGFIEKKKLIVAEKGNRIEIKKPVWISTTPNGVPIVLLNNNYVIGLATFANFRYVKTTQGTTGWIDVGQL